MINISTTASPCISDRRGSPLADTKLAQLVRLELEAQLAGLELGAKPANRKIVGLRRCATGLLVFELIFPALFLKLSGWQLIGWAVVISAALIFWKLGPCRTACSADKLVFRPTISLIRGLYCLIYQVLSGRLTAETSGSLLADVRAVLAARATARIHLRTLPAVQYYGHRFEQDDDNFWNQAPCRDSRKLSVLS